MTLSPRPTSRRRRTAVVADIALALVCSGLLWSVATVALSFLNLTGEGSVHASSERRFALGFGVVGIAWLGLLPGFASAGRTLGQAACSLCYVDRDGRRVSWAPLARAMFWIDAALGGPNVAKAEKTAS